MKVPYIRVAWNVCNVAGGILLRLVVMAQEVVSNVG